MKPYHPLVVLGAACKFYSRPIRHWAESHGGRGPNLRLGPRNLPGHRLILRPPRLSDASAWRFLRLRDQQSIEPFWVSSTRTWAERHTVDAWVDDVLYMRRESRAGRALPLVIEVDGRFVGQLNLDHIDRCAKNAELGIWLDSECRSLGIATTAGNLLFDYVFNTLGLRRVTAPVCVDNRRAAHSASQFGFRREGTMVSYLDVGGQRKDHDLYAITSEMWAVRSGGGSFPSTR